MNITNSGGFYVCEDGSGGPGTLLNPAYTGMTNSQILVTLGAYWFTPKINDEGLTGWAELYAQALAYVAWDAAILPTPPYAYIVPDQLFKNTFFGCTQQWLTAIRAGSTTPPVNTACSGAVPTH